MVDCTWFLAWHIKIHKKSKEQGEKEKTPLAFLSLGKDLFWGVVGDSPMVKKGLERCSFKEGVWVEKSLLSAEMVTALWNFSYR